jgi:pimeloyl-ACP methyl ester carboxylesterase
MPGTNRQNRPNRKPSQRNGRSKTRSAPPTAGPDGWFEDTLSAADDLGLIFNPLAKKSPPESRSAFVNGLRLRYLDWGNSHLPDLLFVHGFAQQAHSWDFAALALRDMFHIIAIDLRGHGESDPSPNGVYSFNALYADIDAFITAVQLDNPALCGLSLGGTLSYLYASTHPAGVRALVIAESAPKARNTGRQSIRNFTSGPTEFDSLDILVEKVRTLTPWRSVAQVQSSLVHSVGKKPNGKWSWKYDPAIRELLNSSTSVASRWAALANITAPTLLVRGEDSDSTDAETFERMAEAIPDSQVVSISQAGHRVSGDNPREFNAALRSFMLRHALQTEGS